MYYIFEQKLHAIDKIILTDGNDDDGELNLSSPIRPCGEAVRTSD